jgi:hypothetical protein
MIESCAERESRKDKNDHDSKSRAPWLEANPEELFACTMLFRRRTDTERAKQTVSDLKIPAIIVTSAVHNPSRIFEGNLERSYPVLRCLPILIPEHEGTRPAHREAIPCTSSPW